MTIRLRPAEISDAERLFAWRNDPATRAASRSTGEVAWADHVGWLERSLQNPDRKLFVGERDGVPAGTVRADRIDDGWTISWTVAPESRGAGVGGALVTALVATLDGAIDAEIRADNLGSQAVARRAGLSFSHEADGLQIWRLER